MFDFENLTVYKKAKAFHKKTQKFLRESPNVDRVTANQLRRAAVSIPLNIAEGSGRFTKPDRRNFFVISRSSIFECAAIYDILNDEGLIEENLFNELHQNSEELSKILFAMIRNLQKT